MFKKYTHTKIRRIQSKAQIFSMDLILGILVFILILVGLVSIFIRGNFNRPIDAYNYEMDYIYRNLETNLMQLPSNMVFLHNSRVDVGRMHSFVTLLPSINDSIDTFVIGNLGSAKGIGLDPSAYDVCLYFTDNRVDFMGYIRIGQQ